MSQQNQHLCLHVVYVGILEYTQNIKLTELLVENIAKEKTDVKDQMLGVNVIEVTIDGKKIEFPNIAVIKSKLEKAEDLKTSFDTNLV